MKKILNWFTDFFNSLAEARMASTLAKNRKIDASIAIIQNSKR